MREGRKEELKNEKANGLKKGNKEDKCKILYNMVITSKVTF